MQEGVNSHPPTHLVECHNEGPDGHSFPAGSDDDGLNQLSQKGLETGDKLGGQLCQVHLPLPLSVQSAWVREHRVSGRQ